MYDLMHFIFISTTYHYAVINTVHNEHNTHVCQRFSAHSSGVCARVIVHWKTPYIYGIILSSIIFSRSHLLSYSCSCCIIHAQRRVCVLLCVCVSIRGRWSARAPATWCSATRASRISCHACRHIQYASC